MAENGNTVAMREALEHCEKLTREFVCGKYYRVDFPQMLLGVIRDALAAPTRNCDRFNSGEEAWIAFEREQPNWCDEHSSKDPECMDCEMADCGRCMAEWLLEPAKEGK